MRRILVLAAVWCIFSISVVLANQNEKTFSHELLWDVFTLKPIQVQGLERRGKVSKRSVALDDIIRVGARALEWLDLLQKDVPPEKREQIWRRVDRVGHEPSAEKPMFYNEKIIVDAFEKVMREAPRGVANILLGTQSLPPNLPLGVSMEDLMKTLRPNHTIYSRASRWLVLYEYRNSMGKGSRDYRGWLTVRADRDALLAVSDRWANQSIDARRRFIAEVSQACPLVAGRGAKQCEDGFQKYVNDPNATQVMRNWVVETIRRGQWRYDSHFGVRQAHANVGKRQQGRTNFVLMPTYDIEPEILKWIDERVQEAWTFPGSVGVTLNPDSGNVSGAMRVVWQKGALPNVNGIAGDVVTMDENMPRWLEVSQIVMRHEFGHVLGFDDCYTEFWDDDLEAFTYYVLDATDRMCALSGDTLDRHRLALLNGYFGSSR